MFSFKYFLLQIVIGRHTKVIDLTSDEQQVTVFALHSADLHHPEFWITWYNKTIKMGLWGKEHPFLVYPMHTDLKIEYVQFNTLSGNWAPVEWIVESKYRLLIDTILVFANQMRVDMKRLQEFESKVFLSVLR